MATDIMAVFTHTGDGAVGTAVKKTISLRERLRQGFLTMQGYWARKAKGKGILTERDLNKYLNGRSGNSAMTRRR
jgi:hypothetical protein